jgi:hypothetical protein
MVQLISLTDFANKNTTNNKLFCKCKNSYDTSDFKYVDMHAVPSSRMGTLGSCPGYQRA